MNANVDLGGKTLWINYQSQSASETFPCHSIQITWPRGLCIMYNITVEEEEEVVQETTTRQSFFRASRNVFLPFLRIIIEVISVFVE